MRSENLKKILRILEKRDFATELLDKEEEVADFQDDFTHIGVSMDYTRRAGDLEEDLDEAEYEDNDDMEGESEEEKFISLLMSPTINIICST